MTPERLIHDAAVLVAGLFAGGSLFISLVDVPSRMSLGPALAHKHFREMYPRATNLQAPLAAGGSVLAVALWLVRGEIGAAIAAVSLGSVVVFTLAAIMPTNRRLMDSTIELSDDEVLALLDRWKVRHGVRTLLGIIAVTALLLGPS